MVFFSLTYFMLLPGFAKDVLNAGPGDLGLLISLRESALAWFLVRRFSLATANVQDCC